MPTYSLVTTDDEGHITTEDITDLLESCAETASALTVAVKERMKERGETEEEALESVTADYTRAMIEEGGFDALKDLLRAFSVPFEDLPLPETAVCKHCQRGIEYVDEQWVDPEATGDDSMWRETCGGLETWPADHEPALDVETCDDDCGLHVDHEGECAPR